jgi:hypothetical protein
VTTTATSTSTPTSTATPIPKPRATAARPFDAEHAKTSLAARLESLPICSRGEVDGPGIAQITWAPSGEVDRVVLSRPYAGTSTGACIARRIAAANVRPFDGPEASMRVRFEL